MPAYNAQKYIIEAISSVVNQSYKNWELIIVNDGSIDGTVKELKKVTDSRIRIYHQQNKGQCNAVNKAFSYSKGQLIKFLDADDVLSEEFIERQVAILNGDLNKIASSEWGRFYNNDLSTFKLNPESVWRNMKPIDWLIESLSSRHNMMQCGLWLIPRAILKNSGLWNEKLSLINDFDFIIRVVLSAEQILFTENATLYYRSGLDNSLSKQTSDEAMKSAWLSLNKGIETMLSYENSSRVKNAAADTMKLWMFNFYPFHYDLYIRAKTKVLILGGSNFKFPAGGKTKVLVKLIGWKLAKIIKYYFKS